MARTVAALLCGIFTVGLVNGRIERFSAFKEVVRPGENIVLKCEFADLDSHDTVSFNKNHPGNKSTALTANYDFAESLLGDNRQFNFSFTESGGGFVTQTLTILNSVPGDSGNYSCFMRDLDKNRTTYYAYLNIAVEDEPDTIKFFLDDIEVYNGSNSVPLRFLLSRRLRCETTRSNPGANITITVGDGKRVHLTNVTVGNATYAFDERDPTSDFLVPVYRNTTALVSNWVFDTEAYGKPVVCSAKVGRDAPGIMTSFLPVVADGPPVFACNDTVYARDGQRNFAINCFVYASPTLTKARFDFFKDKTRYVIVGLPVSQQNESADGGRFRGKIERFDDVKFLMTLTITAVDLKAAITFNFIAENEQGQEIHDIMIKDPTMASSSVAVSSLGLVNFLFVCIFGFGLWGQL